MLRITTKRLSARSRGIASVTTKATATIVTSRGGVNSRKWQRFPHSGENEWSRVTAALVAGGLGVVAASSGNNPAWLDGDTNAAAAAATTPSFTVEVGEPSRSDSARWESVLEKCIPGVVSIKVNATRSFDTSAPGASQATGFVVDAKQGLVLTNRHVVQSGPVLAEALFQNHEEVPLRAVYRDPVHDFGLFQFDPKNLRHLKVPELPLHPELAKVGLDIRVMGNNAGEKLAILSGTLARLDRGAPNYGRNSFNDHNTFYFQAASNTSGGSSGSPVINSDGKVVALNAAGMVGTASSYYLPLDRVKRAVDLIRRGEPVSRGTLQTTFEYRPFNELARVGLPSQVEAAVRARNPGGVGMLCVSSLVPEGPGHRAGLQPGDVLLSMAAPAAAAAAVVGNNANNKGKGGKRLVTLFPDLEEILDDAVGGVVALEVLRGGKLLRIQTLVQDLHAITPASFLEMGESVFHDLSYHQARNHACPVEGQGVYVCQAGYMLREAGVTAGSLILSVDGAATPTLAHLQKALEKLPDGQEVAVRVRHVSNRHQSALTRVRVDRTWFPTQRVERLEVATNKSSKSSSGSGSLSQASPCQASPSDALSDWAVTPCASPPSLPPPPPLPSVSPVSASQTRQTNAAAAAAATTTSSNNGYVRQQQPPPPLSTSTISTMPTASSSLPKTRFPPGANKAEAAVAQSLVQVHFNMPYMIDGTVGSQFSGTGVVVDTAKGLVVVDRNTVPSSLGDVRLSVGSSLEIPGKVEYIHPLHNLAVLSYDPSLLGSGGEGGQVVPLKAATLVSSSSSPKKGAASLLADLENDFVKGGSGAVFKKNAKKENKNGSADGEEARQGNTKTKKYTIVGLQGNKRTGTQLVSKAVTSASVSHGQPVGLSHPPRFQDANLEVLALEGGMQSDGVVVDPQGRVAGLYASFSLQMNSGGRLQNVQAFQAIPAELLSELVEPLARGEQPAFHTLGVEFEYVGLSQVRGMGLDDATIAALEAGLPSSSSSSASSAAASSSSAEAAAPLPPSNTAPEAEGDSQPLPWPPRLLGIKRRWGGYPAQKLLEDGDVVLSVEGRPVHSFRQIEVACAANAAKATKDAAAAAASGAGATTTPPPPKSEVALEVLRGGERVAVRVGTVALGSDETTKVLMWGGAVLQKPPQAVARQRGVDCSGVYVAANHRGSPAGKYGLNPTSRIVEVDGVSTPSLDAFMAATKHKKHGDSVRLKQEDLRGVSTVSALKLDMTYWPTYEVGRCTSPPSWNSGSGGGAGNKYTWRRSLVTPTQKTSHRQLPSSPSSLFSPLPLLLQAPSSAMR